MMNVFFSINTKNESRVMRNNHALEETYRSEVYISGAPLAPRGHENKSGCATGKFTASFYDMLYKHIVRVVVSAISILYTLYLSAYLIN